MGSMAYKNIHENHKFQPSVGKYTHMGKVSRNKKSGSEHENCEFHDQKVNPYLEDHPSW